MNFDYFLFQQINAFAGRWVALDWLGIFAASYLQYLVVGFLLVYLFYGKDQLEKNKNRLMVGLSLLGALAARFGIAAPLYYIFTRPRPFVAHAVNQLIAYDGARSSFPSGHASFFFALATVVYFYNKKLGIWFYFFSALMALSRVFVGVHYPSDILAGALIGIFCGWLIYYLLNQYQNKKAL